MHSRSTKSHFDGRCCITTRLHTTAYTAHTTCPGVCQCPGRAVSDSSDQMKCSIQAAMVGCGLWVVGGGWLDGVYPANGDYQMRGTQSTEGQSVPMPLASNHSVCHYEPCHKSHPQKFNSSATARPYLQASKQSLDILNSHRIVLYFVAKRKPCQDAIILLSIVRPCCLAPNGSSSQPRASRLFHTAVMVGYKGSGLPQWPCLRLRWELMLACLV